DIDEHTSPVEARLNFAVRSDKKDDFIGRASIKQLKERGPSRVRTGFRITDKGIPRQGQEICSDDVGIGRVTSGTLSPTLGVGIGMGYASPRVSKPGQSLEIMIRDRRVSASVVRMPFYQRRSECTFVVVGEELGHWELLTRLGSLKSWLDQY